MILVMVNTLIKIMYYESVKITIDIAGLVEIMINNVVRQYGLSKSIISDRSLLLYQSSGLHYTIFLTLSRNSLL